jgi:glucose/arabinose dehydrogenase
MRKILYTIVLFLPLYLQAQPPTVSFQSLQTGLASPVDVVNAGDGSNRLFFVEKAGRIRIWKNGALLTAPFLNMSTVVLNNASERGLLSLAFHPNYAVNRYFFVYYTNSAGDITVARYRTSVTNADSAELSSAVVLLTIPKPFNNHNGGKLNFGPDGYLYFGTGDGGSGGDPSNFAQNGNSLLGKMLRIDVNGFATSAPFYTIPPDNPYISNPAVLDEIWALGLRNPWRWSFDRQTNDMWIADVGQNVWEEVNFRTLANSGGINYGWRCYEGNATFNTTGCAAASSYIAPVFQYPHNNATGGFSITGGYVYRGSEFPTLQGYYLCVDYVTNNGWLIRPDGSGGWTTTLQAGWPAGISGFGESENGTLYAVTLGGGFFKVNVLAPIPLRLVQFTATAVSDGVLLRWTTADEVNTQHFDIEYSTNAQQFTTIGSVTATRNTQANDYRFVHPQVAVNTPLYYRLKMVDRDGQFTYSPVVRLDARQYELGTVWPTLITDKRIRIFASAHLQGVVVSDATGKTMTRQAYTGNNNIMIDAANWSAGMYFIRLYGDKGERTVKVVIQ